MKFEIENCPECGEEAESILEGASGIYPLIRGGDDGPEDELNYDCNEGGGDSDFDGALRDIEERVTLFCPSSHTWKTREVDLPVERTHVDEAFGSKIYFVRVATVLDWETRGWSVRQILEDRARYYLDLPNETAFEIDISDGAFRIEAVRTTEESA